MNKWLRQLEHENNEMHVQKLQYQHQIEANNNKQMPSSSRFCTNIWPMPSLKTPDDIITNVQASGPGHNRTNDQAHQIQEEPTRPYWIHNKPLEMSFNQMHLSFCSLQLHTRNNCSADSPFTDNISLVEMPQKFSFLNMKLYDGTSNLDDHIAQYK